MRQAVRDHARRRLEPRQQDRLLAHRARRLRRPPAAVQRRLPGRREHPGLALRRRGGRRGLRARPGASSWRTTRSRRSWAGSATTRARPPATAASSTRRSASTRSSASSATRRSSRAGRFEPSRPRRSGKRVLVVGAGPVRAVGRLPPRRASATTVTIHEAGPMAGGMMRFGIPKYRLPRDVLDAEVAAHPRHGRDARAEPQGHRHPRRRCGGRLRRRLPRGRRPHRQARLHPGRRGGADPRRGLAAAQHGGRGAAAARPARRRLRRRQHRDGRRPHRQAARRRARRSSSTGARASGCPRTTSRSRRPRRRAC